MKEIKILIVDDEVNAQKVLIHLLKTYAINTVVIGAVTNVDDAERFVITNKPDLVLLDIEMPKKSGFELIPILQNLQIKVIFVTAYHQYAIKAFEASVVDYLLKPVLPNRLLEAIEKVMSIINLESYSDQIEVLSANMKGEQIKTIALKYKDIYDKVPVRNIVCIEVDGSYCTVYTTGRKYTLAKQLTYFEKLLDPTVFFKPNRAWLINTAYINGYSKRNKKINLGEEILVPLSRTKKEAFDKLFSEL